MLRIGSLFSGIGGLELGLEAALDARTVWQVEMDPYARRVLAKHWPLANRQVLDVREAGAATLSPVDIICGGFPCQDISVAGKGAGLAGSRSGLWHEFHRVVRELRPRIVVVENVPALVNRGLDVVLGALAECGYDAEWGVFSAAAVGAPHLRKRLFVLAWRCVADLSSVGLQPWPGPAWRPSEGGQPADGGADVADTNRAGLEVKQPRQECDQLQTFERGGRALRRWAVEPDVGRVAHGVPSRVDRLKCLGNSVVPAVAYEVGLRVSTILAGLEPAHGA